MVINSITHVLIIYKSYLTYVESIHNTIVQLQKQFSSQFKLHWEYFLKLQIYIQDTDNMICTQLHAT
jgi:hypothetical protein